MKTFTVTLGEIPVDASDTDATLRKKAQNHLPEALRRMGEKAGQEAWATMERELRGSPLKINGSSSDKAKFIRDAAAEFVSTATADDKKNLVQSIFDQLREQRDAKA